MTTTSGQPTVWIDGELRAASDVRISPFDHGLLTGDGVFETLVTERGVPFAWSRHLARLRHSAAGLGLALAEGAVLRAAADAVIAANGFAAEGAPRGRVRITVTGGVAPPGSGRGGGRPMVLVTATPVHEPEAVTDVVTVPWPRNERSPVAGLKTTSYAENVVALAHAQAAGATEALFANTVGNLCEGTGANVFCVLGGTLVTPPLAAGCLAGVTRGLVVELTGAEERDVPFAALADADEVFLTSTTRAVQAVRRLDERALAAPGPATREAAAALAALVARDLDP
jgi:branched-chain amino acid aminotransferase